MVLNQITLSGCECLARKAKAYIEAYPDGMSGGDETEDSRILALSAFLYGVASDETPMLGRGVYDLIESGFHLSLPWEHPMLEEVESQGRSSRAFLVHAANPIGPGSYDQLTDIATFPVSPRLQAIIEEMCRLDYRAIPTPAS